jgi:signal transduction histidine kinase
MTRMVSDMLFLAQADNNQLIPDRVMFDLSAEVMKVFDFFEAWAEERHVTLKFNGMPCLMKAIRRCSEEQSIICSPTPCAIRRKGKAVTVSIREQDNDVELVTENPGTPIPQRICQSCLTVFIASIRQGSVRRRQRDRPCHREIHRHRASRKSPRGIGCGIDALHPHGAGKVL